MWRKILSTMWLFGKNDHVIVITDGVRVTELRAGRVPEVYLVEGCS